MQALPSIPVPGLNVNACLWLSFQPLCKPILRPSIGPNQCDARCSLSMHGAFTVYIRAITCHEVQGCKLPVSKCLHVLSSCCTVCLHVGACLGLVAVSQMRSMVSAGKEGQKLHVIH